MIRLMIHFSIKVSHNVLIDRLSVSQRISELTDRLEREGTFTFTSMFRFAQPDVEMTYAEIKHEAVVTLLAVLEMAKLRLIAIRQDEGDVEIHIARVAEDLREASPDQVRLVTQHELGHLVGLGQRTPVKEQDQQPPVPIPLAVGRCGHRRGCWSRRTRFQDR